MLMPSPRTATGKCHLVWRPKTWLIARRSGSVRAAASLTIAARPRQGGGLAVVRAIGRAGRRLQASLNDLNPIVIECPLGLTACRSAGQGSAAGGPGRAVPDIWRRGSAMGGHGREARAKLRE